MHREKNLFEFTETAESLCAKKELLGVLVLVVHLAWPKLGACFAECGSHAQMTISILRVLQKLSFALQGLNHDRCCRARPEGRRTLSAKKINSQHPFRPCSMRSCEPSCWEGDPTPLRTWASSAPGEAYFSLEPAFTLSQLQLTGRAKQLISKKELDDLHKGRLQRGT